MRLWTKLLPFFIVEWWAVRNLERYEIRAKEFVQPYGPGTIDWLTGERFPERITLIEVDPENRVSEIWEKTHNEST